MKTKLPILLLLMVMTCNQRIYSQGVVIPSNSSQTDFLKTYKLVLNNADKNFRLNNGADSLLFPQDGEYSLYWAKTGADRGSFVLADTVPVIYSSVSSTPYSVYNWQTAEHDAIQFKRASKPVAIFQSLIKQNNISISWESLYFRNMFDSWLFNDMYSFVNENNLDTAFLPSSTKLLIIPAFSMNGTDNKFYIDSLVNSHPALKTKIDSFLSRGGSIYTEGNAAYFLEKIQYLNNGAVDFTHLTNPNPVTS